MSELRVLPFVLACCIFALTYAAILAEKVHRTIVALAGCAVMLLLGAWFGFYSVEQAAASIDLDTITLLFGMMVIVGMFQTTGLFEYVAIRTAKLTRGRPWLLFVSLGLVTSLVSTILDNVTTILIIVPVTISIADLLGLPLLPLLMNEVLMSNVGGTATLIGDPPNILIGSAAGLSFNDFLVHLAPIVLVAWVGAQGLLLLLFHRSLSQRPGNVDRLLAMDERGAIENPRAARKLLIVLAVTLVIYFVHDRIGLAPGLVALFGACLGLLWVRPKLEAILKEIPWDVLLFFVALFVIVGGLQAAGVLSELGRLLSGFAGKGAILPAVVVLWVSAVASGVISSVPFTIAMLPVIQGLGAMGIDTVPLWWALALGAGFGANLTPIGGAANVVVMSMSDRTGERITFAKWARSGMAVSLLTCAIGSVALALSISWGLL